MNLPLSCLLIVLCLMMLSLVIASVWVEIKDQAQRGRPPQGWRSWMRVLK